MILSNLALVLSNLPSNSSSKKPLFKLEYEIESLDVLFAFEYRMAVELEDQDVEYETEISIDTATYHITYFVYA